MTQGQAQSPAKPAGSDGAGGLSREQRDQLRGALIAAAYHAHRDEAFDQLPAELRPQPLDEAVEVLRQAQQPVLTAHALAWLLDHPRNLDENAGAIQRLSEEHDGVPERGDLDELPSSIYRGHPSDRPCGDLGEPTRFATVLSAIRGGSCVRSGFNLVTTFDPRSLITEVGARVHVNRPATDFSRLADPRNWAVEAQLFFEESELVEFDQGQFVLTPDPAPIGTKPFTNRLLREVVTLGLGGAFPMDGTNVLVIDCDPTAAGPWMEVSLHASVETLIGASFARGGLDLDSGSFQAVPDSGDPGACWMSGTKVARFTERSLFGFEIGGYLNYYAALALAPFMALLIYEGACA